MNWHRIQKRRQVQHDALEACSMARLDEAMKNPSKSELRAMLAEAAANTAKIQDRGTGE